MLRFLLKFLPLVLHEVADYIKEKQQQKREQKEILTKMQENEKLN
jgi:hypothetical protein